MSWRPDDWSTMSLWERLDICENAILARTGTGTTMNPKYNCDIRDCSEWERLHMYEKFIDRHDRQSKIPKGKEISSWRRAYLFVRNDPYYGHSWDMDEISRNNLDVFNRNDILDYFKERRNGNTHFGCAVGIPWVDACISGNDNPTFWTDFVCSIDEHFTTKKARDALDLLYKEFDRRFAIWDSVSKKTGISRISEYLLFDIGGSNNIKKVHLHNESRMLELYSPDFCAKLMNPTITVKEWQTDPILIQLLLDAHQQYRMLSKTQPYHDLVQARIEEMAEKARFEMEKASSEFKIQQSRYYELYAIAEVF